MVKFAMAWYTMSHSAMPNFAKTGKRVPYNTYILRVSNFCNLCRIVKLNICEFLEYAHNHNFYLHTISTSGKCEIKMPWNFLHKFAKL